MVPMRLERLTAELSINRLVFIVPDWQIWGEVTNRKMSRILIKQMIFQATV